jgi:hypothetical protein
MESTKSHVGFRLYERAFDFSVTIILVQWTQIFQLTPTRASLFRTYRVQVILASKVSISCSHVLGHWHRCVSMDPFVPQMPLKIRVAAHGHPNQINSSGNHLLRVEQFCLPHPWPCISERLGVIESVVPDLHPKIWKAKIQLHVRSKRKICTHLAYHRQPSGIV